MPKQNKFKSTLVHKAKEDIAEEKKQRELKEKHSISEENVVVVEKANNYKFTINNLKALFQLTACILIIVLCVIGIVGLVYPGPRGELYKIFHESLLQIKELIQ